jgi:hypothetical protein
MVSMMEYLLGSGCGIAGVLVVKLLIAMIVETVQAHEWGAQS